LSLRSWILGIDPNEVRALINRVHELEKETITLKAEIKALSQLYGRTFKDLLRLQKSMEDVWEKVDNKADKKSMERELESLSKLVMAVYDKLKDLEAYSDYSTMEKLESKDKDILVLNLLRQGYTSPSEILSRLEISSRELYEVLKRLEEKKKIGKFRKGRKVHYYITEEV